MAVVVGGGGGGGGGWWEVGGGGWCVCVCVGGRKQFTHETFFILLLFSWLVRLRCFVSGAW